MTGRNKIQHLSAYMVEQLLRRMDKQFTPPLCQQVDIQQYAQKLALHAEFLTIDEVQIDSLIAFYSNHDNHKAYIPLVWVDSAKRRRGLGASMLDALHRHLSNRGMTSVSLEVHKNNQSAFSLYSRSGYRIVEDRQDKWLMCRNLSTKDSED